MRNHLAGALLWLATTPVHAQDLSGGGAYDTIEIAGFLVPVQDVEQLLSARILRFDTLRSRFSFDTSVSSERQLRQEIRSLDLTDARAVKDLYRAYKVPLPNGAAHVLTIPSGFGPAIFSNQPGKVSFGLGIGGVGRVPYTSDPDGGLALGVGFGNAFEGLGVSVSMSFNDLSEFGNSDRISWGVEVSHYLSDGVSVALGGENLFVGQTDGEASYYVVGSWAFDRDTGLLPFDGVATLGIGSGRFAHKTPRDEFEGKGSDATAVFGALAWEVTDSFNVISDWNGRNLSAGIAVRLPNYPVSVKLGVRDLTGFTGDGPRLTGSVGISLARF